MNKNEYRLVIDINDGTGGGIDAITGQNGGKKNPFKDTSAVADTKKAISTMQGLVKYQIAQPYINMTKQIIYNEVETKTGSGELAQRIQLGTNMVHQATGTAIYGASLGSILGVGAGAGVGIAVALTAIKTGLDLITKHIELQNKTKLENEQLSILRGRAGVQFNRSRSGE